MRSLFEVVKLKRREKHMKKRHVEIACWGEEGSCMIGGRGVPLIWQRRGRWANVGQWCRDEFVLPESRSD